jgi:hypothetical protein
VSVKPKPEVEEQAGPPAPAATKSPNQFIKHDSAYTHIATGEMWVPASDGSGMMLPTGQYFENVTQSLPSINDMEGPRTPGIVIRPWAFAKLESAWTLMEQLKAMVSSDVTLSVENSDANTQFPYSHPQRQIVGKRGDRRARINAGMLASNIARSTALLDGSIHQFPQPALEAAAGELMRELDRTEE